MRLCHFLTLPLALSLLACDQSGPESQRFRSADVAVEPAATVRLGTGLESVRVTSYAVGGAIADSLSEEGFDALLAGAEEADEGAILVLHLDGVAPLRPADIDEAFIELRREDEVLALPYKQFKFQVSVSSSGQAATELVLIGELQDDTDYSLWHDPLGAAELPPPSDPVEAIEYELIVADGTVTTCSPDVLPVEQLSFGFTPIKGDLGRFGFDITDECAEVLEHAAESSPPDAFYVRCDATTTTQIGMHKVADITLKRGVVSATAALVIDGG